VSKKIVNEGLRAGDLREMIYSQFEVDTFRSKMGEDQDVCVLTFQAKDRYPAKDMMEFIEKGFPFVLDADVSAGENEKGEYSVFVEVQRSENISENIKEILFGLERLTGINDWEFSYYKNKKAMPATTENLKKIPNSGKVYEQTMKKFATNEVKTFFNKTLMDDLELDNNIITIRKPFDVTLQFELVDQGSNNLAESLEDAPTIDDQSTAEVFWLTKVMGNYDIHKFGDKYLFTNEDRSMVLKRI